MDRFIQVIDNFIPGYADIRPLIDSCEFGEFGFWGKRYAGVGEYTLPLKALIEDVLGEPIYFVQSHIRLGTKHTPLTHYIHADNAAAKYACVVYLSEPDCDTGTAFWSHKALGVDRLQMPCPPEVFAKLDADIADESKWDRLEYVQAKENRAVIFDSQLFHSRYPQHLPIATGETPRLVSTIFFNKVSEAPDETRPLD